MTTINLFKSIKKVASQLKSHMGAGDDAHMPADTQHAGFMTPDMYIGLMGARGNRELLNPGTDILKTVPGHYYGTSLVNSPLGDDSTALQYVDIDGAARENFAPTEHLRYQVTVAYTGQKFERVVHTQSGKTNASAPLGWCWIPKVETLWEGNVTEKGTELTLTDSIYKFSNIAFTVDNRSGGIPTIFAQSKSGMGINFSNLADSQHGLVVFEMGFNAANDDGTALTLTRSSAYQLYDQWSDGALGAVRKIDGVL